MSEDTIDVVVIETDPAIVKEAEGQGWVPKEKYRGDEKDWVDAEQFVKRGREILPILRKNNENLIKELNHTKEQLKEFKQTADEFKVFQKENYERKIKDYQNQVISLKESRAQAITDGDGQKVNALDDAIDEAKAGIQDAKDAVKDPVRTDIGVAPDIDPTLQKWLDRNEWFGKDKRITQMTNAIGEVLRTENPNLFGEEFLDRLDEVLKEEFPDRFGAKKRPAANQVESGAGKSGRGSVSTHSYDNLPADAKSACDRYVKQKLMSREEYVADYDWN